MAEAGSTVVVVCAEVVGAFAAAVVFMGVAEPPRVEASTAEGPGQAGQSRPAFLTQTCWQISTLRVWEGALSASRGLGHRPS
jgi:hypothetical protein